MEMTNFTYPGPLKVLSVFKNVTFMKRVYIYALQLVLCFLTACAMVFGRYFADSVWNRDLADIFHYQSFFNFIMTATFAVSILYFIVVEVYVYFVSKNQII